ncbi:MAG: DsbA family protein, partial [Rhodobacteraceae bacterium]|nr:DsbA family protein [Paracoccaceae bacterium]
MADPIRFYFDFNSTFSYIAIQSIDDLAASLGRTVDWRAVSLAHLFKAQNITPPPLIPAKLKYLAQDFARSCEFAGLPCKMPPNFPPDVKLARLTFWHLKATDDAAARAFAKKVSMAIFGQGQDLASAAGVASACAGMPGITAETVAAAESDFAAKRAVIQALDDAVADG